MIGRRARVHRAACSAALLLTLLATLPAAASAQGRISNANLETRPLKGPIAAAIQALDGPATLDRLPDADGVRTAPDLLRTNRNGAVRKQAMFWLGQSHDARAVAFFEEILKGR